jgi:uncharacterized lipoprotein
MRSLVLALGVVGLLAGCGDDQKPAQPLSKKAYEDQFNALVAKVDAGPKVVAPPNATPQQQGEALDNGLQKIRSLAAALDRLNPPADIRRAHDQFVEALGEIADQGQLAVKALKAGDDATGRRLVSSFAKPATLREITAARKEFVRKGYHLGEVSPSP